MSRYSGREPQEPGKQSRTRPCRLRICGVRLTTAKNADDSVNTHPRSSSSLPTAPSVDGVPRISGAICAHQLRSIPQSPLPLRQRWLLQRSARIAWITSGCPPLPLRQRWLLQPDRPIERAAWLVALHCRCASDGCCNPAMTPQQQAIQRQSIPRFSRNSIHAEKRGRVAKLHRATRCPADGRAYGVCAAPTPCAGAARCREVS